MSDSDRGLSHVCDISSKQRNSGSFEETTLAVGDNLPQLYCGINS